MQKISIIIPKNNNDGRPFPEDRIRSIELELLKISGGYSRYDVTGQWIDGGKIYTDISFKYDLIVTSDQADLVKTVVSGAKTVLNQLSMYFEEQETKLLFL